MKSLKSAQWVGFCAEADADWFGLFAFCIVLEFFVKIHSAPVFILEV